MQVRVVNSWRYAGRGGAFGSDQREAVSWNLLVTVCADTADCELNRKIKRERARARTGVLIWRESRFAQAKLPKGSCHWCGEPIELKDPSDYRRRARQYHYGDHHEVGDHTCRRDVDHSYAHGPRALILLRGDPCCVYCGSEDGWDADHEVPIWRGGEHSVVNLVRACESCHKAKTRAEARERAALRKRN